MLSPKKLLENARNRITKTENWAKGIARTADGHSVEPTSPEACSWCIIGALAAEAGISTDYYSYNAGQHGNYKDAIHAVAQQLKDDVQHPDQHDGRLADSAYSVIYTFNDLYSNHERVLEVLDNAIADMRSE